MMLMSVVLHSAFQPSERRRFVLQSALGQGNACVLNPSACDVMSRTYMARCRGCTWALCVEAGVNYMCRDRTQISQRVSLCAASVFLSHPVGQ